MSISSNLTASTPQPVKQAIQHKPALPVTGSTSTTAPGK